MRKFLFTLAATLFAGVAVAQNSAVYKAQALEQKQDIAGAINVLNEALANPKTTKQAQIYNMLGENYAKLFNNELNCAVRQMPFDTAKFCTLLDQMIESYTKSHEYDIAPDKKGKVNPKFEKANKARLMFMLDYYNYAAQFNYQNHNIDKAVEYFDKYLQLPKNPVFAQAETDSIYAAKQAAYSQTRFNLAYLAFNQKNWDKAIAFAEDALQDTIGTRDLLLIKMNSQLQKGDSAAWLKTLTDAVTRTEDEGFMQNLLYHYVSKNDVKSAENMGNEMVAANPGSKAAWYMKGCVELNLKKDYPAAQESFTKALSIDPDYIEANTNIAYAYINQIVAESYSGKFKYVGTGKVVPMKDKALYEKELATVKSYYQKALPHMLKVRELKPEEPRKWAYTLQMIYENLQMKAEKAEIDEIIKTL